MRPDGRRPDQLRPLEIIPHYQKHAEGSALIKLGDTWVLCSASVEEGVPPFLAGKGKGWLTAEYGMLPGSTHSRKPRDKAGKVDGRGVENAKLVQTCEGLRAALRNAESDLRASQRVIDNFERNQRQDSAPSTHIEHAQVGECSAMVMQQLGHERGRGMEPRTKCSSWFELENLFVGSLGLIRNPWRNDRDRRREGERFEVFFPCITPRITHDLFDTRGHVGVVFVQRSDGRIGFFA